MKAMILAAGMGTRLHPLTLDKPKALLPIGKYTLLEFAILRLKAAGFTEIIINIHYLGQQIIEYLKQNDNFGCSILISDESERLLDTGGAVKKARWFLEDSQDFILYNSDIVCNIDLVALYRHHLTEQPLATLVVRERESSRRLLFDDDRSLCGWENVQTQETIHARRPEGSLHPYPFSGIHVINTDIFNLLPGDDRFSIINLYLDLATRHEIKAFVDPSDCWVDAGKREGLHKASESVANYTFFT